MKKKKIRHYSGIGGQAVLEGVMMRNKDMYAVAVRKPDGDIDVEVDEYHGVASGTFFVKIPFIRGIFIFLDSLILGMKALNHSSTFYEEEDDKPHKDNSINTKATDSDSKEKLAMALTYALSIVLAVGIFMVLPYFLSSIFENYVRNASLLAIIEGVLRILIFVIYILAISQMQDIKRLFRYHGAEHKCINCIERGRPLNVKNAMRSSRLHKRCGSSFVLFVMLVSIVLFFFIRTDSMILRVVYRILLIPVISGISYELIRLAGRTDNIIVSILSAPGLWMQRLTTKEPDEEMIEVAIKSVEAVFDWKEYLKDTFGLEFEEEDYTSAYKEDE
ncbi:MAG: DUF1385 domain-containing protein [Butyrivibrio sp.]|nr:DUF1385 domain-containing protein [Butyrivibrio sp.]